MSQSALEKENVEGVGVRVSEVETSRVIGMWSLVVSGLGAWCDEGDCVVSYVVHEGSSCLVSGSATE